VQLEIEPDDTDADDGEDVDEDDVDEDVADKDDTDDDETDEEGSDREDVDEEDIAEGKLEAIHELPTFNPFSNVYPISSLFWLKNLTTLLLFTSIHVVGWSFSVPQVSTFNLE
jgi:hypothetical protein